MRRITRLRFDNDIHFHPRRRGDHPVYGQVPHSSKQDQMSFIRFAASAPRNAGQCFLFGFARTEKKIRRFAAILDLKTYKIRIFND